MLSKFPTGLVVILAILVCGCSPALYIPSIDDASRTGVSADSLLIGRNLYTNHCGSCHNLHMPEKYTRKHWEEKMPEMQHKAKISDIDAKLITNFLVARSKAE